MEHLATNILWVTGLALPALLFFIGNKFDKAWLVLIRAIASIGLSWLYFFAYAIAAQALSGELVSGAAISFAGMFGWVVPTIIVSVSWFSYYLVGLRLAKKST